MPSKLNIIVRLQYWMDSVPGQTFLNYAYSWGASIIILGALFKLTHLPGANLMLFIGMGTEAFVFFLSAFDRPFDKNEIGKSLAKDFQSDEEILAEENQGQEALQSIVGQEYSASDVKESIVAATEQGATMAAQQIVQAHYAQSEQQISLQGEAQRLSEIIRMANDELLQRAQAVLSPEMEQATEEYIDKLRRLTETLSMVDEQNAHLARDSKEMENLNRTLVGINKVYDMHFASISRQVSTIEEINNQTRQLAAKIEEVNQVYTRMVQTLAFMGQVQGAMPPTNSMNAVTEQTAVTSTKDHLD